MTSVYYTQCTWTIYFTFNLSTNMPSSYSWLWVEEVMLPLTKMSHFSLFSKMRNTDQCGALAANLNISGSTLRRIFFLCPKESQSFQTPVIEKSPNTHSQRRYTLLEEQSTNCKVFNLHPQHLRAVLKNLYLWEPLN